MHGYVDIQKVLSETHTIKSSHRRCSIKKSLLRNFAVFTGKHLCQSLFFNNVADLFFIKQETLKQAFSHIFCEIFKNTFFTKHLWTTVSYHISCYLCICQTYSKRLHLLFYTVLISIDISFNNSRKVPFNG